MSLEPFSTNEPESFDDFAEADLLDLVEGTMTPERAKELAELIRNKRPDLLGVLTRMQADRLALESHLDLEPPRDLVSDIAAAPQSRSLHEREYLEAAEPTVMMERAVRNLGRRRRRRRQAPYIAAIAAGIAGIGITAAIVVLVEGLGRSTQPPSSTTSTQLAAGESVPQATEASARDAVVAEYGLVLRGVDASAFGTDLANLLAFGDAVVVETLALDEGVRNRIGGNASLRAAIQAGDKAIIHESEMLPPPLVGSMEQAPSPEIRLDLAERGFQYAVIIDRTSAADTVAQISQLAESAGLVPAHVEPTGSGFVFDAWQDWQSRATAANGDSAGRLIVPISCATTSGLAR